ncbi:hypothetical protein PO909_026479 [Leuciscus waleckii]
MTHLDWVFTKLKDRVTESVSKTSTVTERLSRTFSEMYMSTLWDPNLLLFLLDSVSAPLTGFGVLGPPRKLSTVSRRQSHFFRLTSSALFCE